MASFNDLKTEWSMLCQECTDCWTKTDLQLAAELGKTLLERNKELENNLKQQQNTIDEQAQEIEYMKKQTAALREVNDSRLRVYEQLEVSIQDLERANHRLALENSSDKKQIKSQGINIESLESRCEEVQKKLDELTTEHETLIRRIQANDSAAFADNLQPRVTAIWKAKVSQDGSIEQVAAPSTPSLDKSMIDTSIRDLATTLASDDEVTDLLRQLHEAKNQRAREQKRVNELGEQLNSILQENASLEEQLNIWRNKAEDMKNLQDEISTLEEVRQGHLCGRCLRGVDSRAHDALSIMLDQEEDDDLSLIDSITTDSHRGSGTPLPQDQNGSKIEDEDVEDNPYRVLVEKYEALLEVQRHPAPRRKASCGPTGGCGGVGGGGGGLSLQEELVMSGDFNSFTTNTSSLHLSESAKTQTSLRDELQSNLKSSSASASAGLTRTNCKKHFSGTPTDLSEAESASSGFSDETYNKSTQTDDRTGSLLCSIADGEDCKFSIYDDASPIESRFRKTPEYRHLFREIFGELKRVAEAKKEGKKLAILDNNSNDNNSSAQRLSTSKILNNDASCCTDDNQSVVSSIISSVVSEPAPYVRSQTPINNFGDIKPSSARQDNNNKNKILDVQKSSNPQSASQNSSSAQRIGNNVHSNIQITPIKRQPLEYLSIGVNIRKKSSAKKNSSRKIFNNTEIRPVTPEAALQTTNPKIIQGKSNSAGRRRFRAANFSPHAAAGPAGFNDQQKNIVDGNNAAVWNGNTLNFFPSNSRSNNLSTRGVGDHQSSVNNYTTTAASAATTSSTRQSNSFVRYVSEQHSTTATYEYRPSTASAEVARLKRLEMSYAEALRLPNKPKISNHNNRRH